MSHWSLRAMRVCGYVMMSPCCVKSCESVKVCDDVTLLFEKL